LGNKEDNFLSLKFILLNIMEKKEMKKLMNRNTILAVHLFFIALMLAAPGIACADECPTIDHTHGEWSAFLQRWVSDGLVDYAALQGDERAPLETYLKKLSATCAIDYEKWSREQRLAFWINAYNAFTVQLIADNYPISSIRKIGWLPAAAFRRKFIPMPGLKGGVISLNEIEHETLRANFREPRIHFALVCASLGCPTLRNEPYRAVENTLYLSPIFDWFQADFEVVDGSVPAYVARYLEDPGISKSGLSIEYTKYDWSLNDRISSD
jgi:hypothetical protein